MTELLQANVVGRVSIFPIRSEARQMTGFFAGDPPHGTITK